MTLPLRFLSEAKLLELREAIQDNLGRYTTAGFHDLEKGNGWGIESNRVQVDPDLLATLDGTERSAEADFRNSVIVHRSLRGMNPAIAREERVWVRLTHLECIAYCRARWLSGLEGESLIKAIQLHAFAAGRTGIRDDNALSRLWWNMHIASIADPEDPLGALKLLTKTADIRMHFIERINTASRPSLAQAVVRAMRRDAWLTSNASAFKHFMVDLNRHGGGVLFEAMAPSKTDSIINESIERARKAASSAG